MVNAQLGTPVTPQKGATLEGAGAALAGPLARAGTLAAAERSRDRLAILSLPSDKGLLVNDLCNGYYIVMGFPYEHRPLGMQQVKLARAHLSGVSNCEGSSYRHAIFAAARLRCRDDLT